MPRSFRCLLLAFGSLAALILTLSPVPAHARVGTVVSSRRKPPAISLRKGITFDRRIFESDRAPTDLITPGDVANCQRMGFDHVKLLFTPDSMMTADGHFAPEKVAGFRSVVEEAVRGGMKCIVCIHPGEGFKRRYLGDPREFAKLLRWYGELGALIAANWPENKVALQLMTEPFGRSPSIPWDVLSDRMIAAARASMPRHTILTSSEYGSLDLLTRMTPGADPNVIYTFTDYEPFLIGINAMPGARSYLPYLRSLPYPGDPRQVDAQRIEECIAAVPEALKDQARQSLTAFAAGQYDSSPAKPNLYGGHYDAAWQRARMRQVGDWSRRHGGVPVMCVEFGCYDGRQPSPRSPGGFCLSVSPSARVRFIGDLRRALESSGIGWSYWSYNEDFSVYRLDERLPMASPDAATLGPSWYDRDLLVDGLGLKPSFTSGLKTIPDTAKR